MVVAENKVAFALANLENVMLNGSPMDEEAFVRRAARESEPISPSKAKRMGKASKKGGDASEDGAGCLKETGASDESAGSSDPFHLESGKDPPTSILNQVLKESLAKK